MPASSYNNIASRGKMVISVVESSAVRYAILNTKMSCTKLSTQTVTINILQVSILLTAVYAAYTL